MKTILIAILFNAAPVQGDEPQGPMPVASSLTVEFDSKDACLNGAKAMGLMSDTARFGVLWACVPKDIAKLEVEKPKAKPSVEVRPERAT